MDVDVAKAMGWERPEGKVGFSVLPQSITAAKYKINWLLLYAPCAKALRKAASYDALHRPLCELYFTLQSTADELR